MAKTPIRTKNAANLWPTAEAWATEYNYILQDHNDSGRLYVQEQKETNAEINVEITQSGDAVLINAWYSDWIRKELALDAASLYASLPREKALSEIQKLITTLGTDPVRKAKTEKPQKNIAFNLGRSIRKLSGKK